MKEDGRSIATTKVYSHLSEFNYSTLRPYSSEALQQEEIKTFVDTRYRDKTTDVDMSFIQSPEKYMFVSAYPYENISPE